MRLLFRLFGGGSGSRKTAAPTIPVNSGAYTTGVEEIVMPMLQAAFTPPSAWSPFDGVRRRQKPTETRVASPSLMGYGGMISGIIFPTKTMALTERVEWFLSRSPKDRVAERSERRSASGIPIAFLHTVSSEPGKPDCHAMHCFFVNGAGDVVDIYCVGRTGMDARTAIEAIIKTLRLLPPE